MSAFIQREHIFMTRLHSALGGSLYIKKHIETASAFSAAVGRLEAASFQQQLAD
jgi:hypothetical protein